MVPCVLLFFFFSSISAELSAGELMSRTKNLTVEIVNSSLENETKSGKCTTDVRIISMKLWMSNYTLLFVLTGDRMTININPTHICKKVPHSLTTSPPVFLRLSTC
eukprot:TRINITY_DN2477_c0_g1_i3.p1 TRINITY_DN2477_c0_g1~~TRINITY_DN2477_c0_g1_i3.p1  ORF type:complete len:106 (-),score=1.56 TRINITY_DN2477_c0_g1_i3:456-773(-)